VVQTKSSQPNPARTGANREQNRRGGAATGAPNRPASPLAGAAGRGRAGRGGNIVHFIHDVRSELRKVHWPTPVETRNLTIVVLALSIAVGLFLGGVDYLFQELFRWLIGATGGGV
jgi:preprotein translocase subunit SecE